MPGPATHYHVRFAGRLRCYSVAFHQCLRKELVEPGVRCFGVLSPNRDPGGDCSVHAPASAL